MPWAAVLPDTDIMTHTAPNTDTNTNTDTDTDTDTNTDTDPGRRSAGACNTTSDGVDSAIVSVERQFMALSASFRHTMREQAAQIALQPAGYRVLVEVVTTGSSGASELAETLGFDKGALSRQLSALESLGLVTRERDPMDGRAVVIRATPDAVERVGRIRNEARDAFRERLATWPPQDLEELVRLLGNLS
jgi:DNA-binding MarR family transcriptional regulator